MPTNSGLDGDGLPARACLLQPQQAASFPIRGDSASLRTPPLQHHGRMAARWGKQTRARTPLRPDRRRARVVGGVFLNPPLCSAANQAGGEGAEQVSGAKQRCQAGRRGRQAPRVLTRQTPRRRSAADHLTAAPPRWALARATCSFDTPWPPRASRAPPAAPRGTAPPLQLPPVGGSRPPSHARAPTV